MIYMPHAVTFVKPARESLGISQTDLAHAAHVSLATIQNVEAGRANPAWTTLTEICTALGLELHCTPPQADWQALITLGLPLQGDGKAHVTRDAPTLRRHLARAAVDLASGERASRSRQQECVEAALLTLYHHYPIVTRSWFTRSAALSALLPTDPSGRVIKLARIARARFAEYL